MYIPRELNNPVIIPASSQFLSFLWRKITGGINGGRKEFISPVEHEMCLAIFPRRGLENRAILRPRFNPPPVCPWTTHVAVTQRRVAFFCSFQLIQNKFINVPLIVRYMDPFLRCLVIKFITKLTGSVSRRRSKVGVLMKVHVYR